MKTCPKCGIQFKKPKVKYCSFECFRESLKIYRPCVECGKMFSGPLSVKRCSKACQYESFKGSRNPVYKNAKLSAICKFCSKEFKYFKGSSTGKYCSQACSYKSPERNERVSKSKTLTFMGEPDRVIKARIRVCQKYKEWRINVFKRDNYTCVKCGAKRHIEAHHIIAFSVIFREVKMNDFRDLRPFFQLDNGETLCETCHEGTDTFFGKHEAIETTVIKLLNKLFIKDNQGFPTFGKFYYNYTEKFIESLKSKINP